MIISERLNLFSGGFVEIGFLLFIAFLLFGPKKLPEIARTLGKGLAELRRASNELKSSLEEEIRNLDRPAENVLGEPSETAPKYGHDHPEPAHEQVEPRP
jgi:TatA/E family protein of Tat protein translocase